METPLEMTFRDVDRTDAIEKLIDEKVNKLNKVYQRITSCHLAIERPQRHLRQGNPYRVRLEVRVPGGHEIISIHEAGQGDMHRSLEAVTRDVFDGALRQLKKLSDKQRGDTKTHVTRDTTGVIIELRPQSDHGFIRSHDGRTVYFHRNSVVDRDFESLELGAAVKFEPDIGEDGLHASTVHVIDPRGTLS